MPKLKRLSGAEVELEQSERTQSFLKWAQQYFAKLPPDYKFDREEVHER